MLGITVGHRHGYDKLCRNCSDFLAYKMLKCVLIFCSSPTFTLLLTLKPASLQLLCALENESNECLSAAHQEDQMHTEAEVFQPTESNIAA